MKLSLCYAAGALVGMSSCFQEPIHREYSGKVVAQSMDRDNYTGQYIRWDVMLQGNNGLRNFTCWDNVDRSGYIPNLLKVVKIGDYIKISADDEFCQVQFVKGVQNDSEFTDNKPEEQK